MPVIPTDSHSFAKPNEARVTHLNWKAFIDFDTKIIKATATWSILSNENAAPLFSTRRI